jgi:hypothetical protein
MTSQVRSPGLAGNGHPPRSRTGAGTGGPATAHAVSAGAGTGPIGGMPAGLVQRVLERLVANGSVASDTASLRAAVTEALAGDGIVLPAANLAAIVTSIGDELTGLGPLAPLLADPTVTDVLVNGPAEVWVERGGTIERAAVRFPSAAAVAPWSSGWWPHWGCGWTSPDRGSTPASRAASGSMRCFHRWLPTARW